MSDPKPRPPDCWLIIRIGGAALVFMTLGSGLWVLAVFGSAWLSIWTVAGALRLTNNRADSWEVYALFFVMWLVYAGIVGRIFLRRLESFIRLVFRRFGVVPPDSAITSSSQTSASGCSQSLPL